MTSEWAENLIRVTYRYGKGGEQDSCYILIGEEGSVIIDSGIASDGMTKRIIETLRKYGSEEALPKYLILTHCHFDHIGNAYALKRKFKSLQIAIHEESAEILEKGTKGLLSKNFPLQKFSERVSLALKSSSFSKIQGIKPDIVLKGGEILDIGSDKLLIENTGGHSADHILIHSFTRKCTFVGDELPIYPNNPYSFYFDITGSPNRRSRVLRTLEKIKTNLICPGHIPPIPREAILEYIAELEAAHNHTEQVLTEILANSTEVFLFDLARDLYQVLGIQWQSPYIELKVPELSCEAFLRQMEEKGEVEYNPNSK
ncbi:MAG: MBL fold metallo-hydrolase, partial [Promethearchaeota archaeon]